MENIFDSICKKCSERGLECCGSKLFLVEDEIKKLKNFKKDLRYRKDRAGFTFVHNRTGGRYRCQFWTDKGCVLSDDLKPFDCLLFPLNMIYKDSEITFYLNKNCSGFDFIPEKWIIETKKFALEKLKGWSEQEKTDFSRAAETMPEKKLIKV